MSKWQLLYFTDTKQEFIWWVKETQNMCIRNWNGNLTNKHLEGNRRSNHLSTYVDIMEQRIGRFLAVKKNYDYWNHDTVTFIKKCML